MLNKAKELYRKYMADQSEENWLNLQSAIVAQSEAVKQMSHSEGWQLMKESLNQDLRNKIRRIYELSQNPVENNTEIAFTRGTIETMSLILKRVGKLSRKANEDVIQEAINEVISKDTNV